MIISIWIALCQTLIINVEAQNDRRCQNDCSKNGICNNGICFCYENFISYNCSTLAYQIDDSNDQELQLYNHPIFFYINLSIYKNQSLELNLSTQDHDGILLYMERFQASYYQYQEGAYTIILQKEIVDYKTPLNLTIYAFGEYYDRLIFGALLNNYTQHNVTPSYLKISLKDTSQNNNTVPTIIIIVIVISIVVAIIIVITLYCIFKTLRRRRMESVAQLRNDKKLPSNLHYNLIQIKSDVINSDEICSICLENILLNGKELSQTQCKHNFHHFCILEWMANHKECPICRCNMAENQQ